MRPSQVNLYDALYMLASDEGREEALFGDCAPLARKAFQRSLIVDEMPFVWFELPLLGEPCFDLHVAMRREALHKGVRFLTETSDSYSQLFRWYAEEEIGGDGLAFAYDVSEGRIDEPAVHVNINGAPLFDIGRFFDLAAGEGAAKLYNSYTDRLPSSWYVWYAGVHPGRPGSPLRVDCYVKSSARNAYATNPGLLVRDLRACGFEATEPELLSLAVPILESPFNLELQFDLLRNGKLGPTIGISAGFAIKTAHGISPLFMEGKPAAELFDKVERLGLADRRWQHIPGASFTTMVKVGGSPFVFSCVPTFVKLRLRNGKPLDAKAYLQAGAWKVDI